MASAPIRGRWFDGRSSQARPVLVAIAAAKSGPSLTITTIDGTAQALTLSARDVEWPEAWSAKREPRAITVDLRDAGALEIDDPAAWRAAFDDAGGRPALAQRMQTRWTVFLAVLLVAGLGLAAFYRWGTPWAATQITRQVPLSWETGLAQRAMESLDGSLLKPSKLSPERQQQLRARFNELVRAVDPTLQRYRGYAPPYSLQFRSGMPPNAFALPGGAIVMTDAIVEEAQKHERADEALLGVLAHEIGHVVHRHTTRLVVEQAVLNVGLGLALGDVSTLASVAGSALTGLAYRREHEAEADCFAVALMRKQGLPAAPMADLLLDLEQKLGGGKSSGLTMMLSSHPATEERALALKAGHAEACR